MSEIWSRIQALLEKDPVIVVRTMVSEGLMDSFANTKVLLAQASDTLKLGAKQAEPQLAAKRLLVAAWVSKHQGVEASIALEAVRKLGLDAVVAYNGDISLLSADIAKADADAEARTLASLVAGKKVPVLDKKAKALVDEYSLNLIKVEVKDPVIVSLDALIDALSALKVKQTA